MCGCSEGMPFCGVFINGLEGGKQRFLSLLTEEDGSCSAIACDNGAEMIKRGKKGRVGRAGEWGATTHST